MSNIKKGYLPYLIGEVACFIAEVILFFLALYAGAVIAVIAAIIAIGVSGGAVWCVYRRARISTPSKKPQRATVKKHRPRLAYPLAILSLILICNPNIGMIDVLPDFIAYFILAKLLSVGIERAPYFMEAKRALVRLGWLNVGKIAGLLLIGYSRMKNAFGNDTAVVVVTVFAAAELVLGIAAVTSVFNALFGLGERTDMRATISGVGKIETTTLPKITYAFLGAKAILNAIPNFFLLTRVDENGVISTVAKGYSFSLVASTLIVLACGIAWCVILSKYTKAIHKEGQFYNSIFILSNSDNEARIVGQHENAKIKAALSLLFAATVSLIDIKFDNTSGINLLPNFIFGILVIIAACRIKRAISLSVVPTVIVSAVYVALSVVSYITESVFLYNYGYSALLGEGAAHAVYNAVELTAVAELFFLGATAVMIGRLLITFTYENTAIPPTDKRYSRADKDFHRAIKNRIIFLVALLITVGVTRCITVYSNGYARLVLNQQATATVTSVLPWIGAVATAITVLLIGFSYYLFTMLKEELDMKYGGEK